MICPLVCLALSLVSCGGKTEGTHTKGDSIVAEMQEMLDTHDTEGLATAFVKAQGTIITLATSGEKEQAEDCIAKLKDFVENNADTLKELVGGGNSVRATVDALRSLPSGIGGKLGEFGEQIKEKAANAVNEAVEAGLRQVTDTAGRPEEEPGDSL